MQTDDMPDFLHKAKESEQHAGNARPVSRFGIRSPRAFRSKRPGSGHAQQVPSGQKKAAPAKKKKERSRLFTEYYGIMFLFLIAGFIAAGYLVLNPLYEDFKSLNGDIEMQVQTLEDEQGYLDSLDRSIAAAEAIPENTLVRVDEALPPDIGIPKLLTTIAKISDLDAIVLSNIQFTPIETSDETKAPRPRRSLELVPIGINLTLQSDGYQATRTFLEDLERNLRVLDMTNINVTGNDQDGSLSYSIELVAYAAQKPELPAMTEGMDGLGEGMMTEDGMMMDDGMIMDDGAGFDGGAL